MKSVAIIGGGITGLTAAFELKKRGIPFRLYEAGDRVGGPIRSVRRDGYLAECGPNTILETSRQIADLVRDLGLESHRLYSNPTAENRYIVRNRRPVPLPRSPGAFLRTRLYSGSAKLRLAAEPFIRRSSPYTEESVADFVRRRLGREILDYAINPFVGGVYAGDPEKLSVKHAFPKLHALEQRYGSLIAGQVLGARERKRRGTVSKQNAPKFSFDEGLDLLPRTLHSRMSGQVCLKHRVSALRRVAEGWHLMVEANGRKNLEEHAAVIIAIPSYELSRFRISGVTTPRLEPLEGVYYPPVASVVLGFRRDEVKHPLDGFGVLVPEVEGMSILGTIFSSSLFPRRAPAGHVTLTSYLGGARAPELALDAPEYLVENALHDLRELLGISGEPVFRHAFVFPRAIPQYNVGFGRFKYIMSELEESAPGLFVGGHCRSGISLGDSITSGFDLAEKAKSYLAQLPDHHLSPFNYAHAA